MGNFEALTMFCSAGHIAADIKSLEDLDTELRDCPTCG